GRHLAGQIVDRHFHAEKMRKRLATVAPPGDGAFSGARQRQARPSTSHRERKRDQRSCSRPRTRGQFLGERCGTWSILASAKSLPPCCRLCLLRRSHVRSALRISVCCTC